MAVFSQHIGRTEAFAGTRPYGEARIGLVTEMGPGGHKSSEEVMVIAPYSQHGGQLRRRFEGVLGKEARYRLMTVHQAALKGFVKGVKEIADPGVEHMTGGDVQVLRPYQVGIKAVLTGIIPL